jgi:hypothetical protein
MTRRRQPAPDVGALGPHAIRLRNSCLGALSRRTSLRPPTPVELSKIRDDLGLREAWEWWLQLDMPMQVVRPVSRRSARPRRAHWRRVAIAVLTSGAWLIVPYATAMALVAMV